MSGRGAIRVVRLTPTGRGAVASLLVEGPAVAELVGAIVHPATGRPLGDQPYEKIVFGRSQSRSGSEEVVVCRRDTNRVEIHCHGGSAAAAAIVAGLTEHGCDEISWQQWVRESNIDPILAAARIALAAAETERTAAILWDQHAGALRSALDLVSADLVGGNETTALERVDALLEWSAVGCHLTMPWKVVLAGRPNVGKSSLINALLGYPRAIVHDAPGTTRDVVAAATAIDGWPIELADTAGLHASTEPVEAAGIRLAEDRLAIADLVLLVFDASSAWSDADEALVLRWPPAMRVFNKSDLVDAEAAAGLRHGGIAVSATMGAGRDDLRHAIAARLVPKSPPVGQAMPFTAGQVAWLREIRTALADDQPGLARQLVGGIPNCAPEAC